MKDTFTMVVERDLESRWLAGEVVELPGCFKEAPDLASLDAAIREAITVYLETVELDDPVSESVGTGA